MTGDGGSRRGSYTAVDEEYLQHSGLRGCRGCCLCSVLIMLLIVALLNAVVTAGLVYFLSITHEGMGSLELFPGGKFLRVLSDVYVERLKLHNGITSRSAMENETFTIAGSQSAFQNPNYLLNFDEERYPEKQTDKITGKSPIYLDKHKHEDGSSTIRILIGENNGSKLEILGNNTLLTTTDFDLLTSEGQSLFSSNTPLNCDLYQVANLHTSQMDVGSIMSHEGYSGLVIESGNSIEVSGMEGVTLDSNGNVDILALKGEINIQSEQGHVILNGEEGIGLSPDLPKDGKGINIDVEKGQFKLCVCGTNGHVFVVPVTDENSGCHRANENVNPCLI